MFDPEFYPTPREVTIKMIEPFQKDIRKKYILEPSAGSGSLLDVLTTKESGYSYLGYRAIIDKKRIYAIEQDPELTFVLQGKGYKVIGNDFLSYKSQYLIDLILMNPPFSNGDEHLLHAWDILPQGDIACLLNAETINNPYTERRKLLKKVIQDNGSVEMLGDCFKTAERKTGVNIALVRLNKKANKNFSLGFEPSEQESHADFTEEINTGNQVALNDKMGAYLRSYEKSKDAFVEYLKARAKLNYYAGSFLEQKDIDSLITNSEKEGLDDKHAIYNTFIDSIKSRAWGSIIGKMGLEKLMTASVRSNFAEFKTAQGAMDLTRENIHQLIMMLCNSSDKILNQAVVDVFDTFTKYHDENRCHIEGWKTNEAWRVNRKVILPNFVSMGYGYHYTTNSHRWETYSDIDKAMCFLSGKRYEDFRELAEKKEYPSGTRDHEKHYKMTSLYDVIHNVEIGDSSEHECEFFTIRCYKKGTLHITFKDEALWARFNQVATDGKFQLGKHK